MSSDPGGPMTIPTIVPARSCASRLGGEKLAEEQIETLRRGVPRIATFDQRPPFFSQTASELRVVEDAPDRLGERRGVVRQQEVAVVLDADALRAERGRDHGPGHRHRL